MKRVFVVAATVTAVLMIATSAMAVPPQVVHEEDFDYTDTIPAGAVCDFEVQIHEVGSAVEKEFYNKDGSLKRFTVHVAATTYWSSAYGEAVEHWAWNGTFDPKANTFTQNGNVWNVHSGAGGVQVNDKGQIVFDDENGDVIKIAGPHEAFTDGLDGLCDAISQ